MLRRPSHRDLGYRSNLRAAVAPGQRQRIGFDGDLFDFANADDAVAHLLFDALFAANSAGRGDVTAGEIRQRIAAMHQSGTDAH
jgi:hypothetical protein